MSLIFSLPGDVTVGWWKIRVTVLQQVEEKPILIEKWFTDRFDVNVNIPAFITAEDKYLQGDVTSNHTNYMPVTANATLNVYRRSTNFLVNKPYPKDRDASELIHTDYVRVFTGSFKFQYDLSSLLNYAPSSGVGAELEIEVIVYDRFYEHTVIGYGRTRIINSTIILKFLDPSPAVFKPGMPFDVHLALSYENQVTLPRDKVALSSTTISSVARHAVVQQDEEMAITYDMNGVAKITFLIDEKQNEPFILNAVFTDGVTSARAELKAIPSISTKNRYLHINSRTKIGKSGEYAIFHVRSNFYMNFFNYIVTSRGTVVTWGVEKALGINHGITSFAVALGPEMAPSCKIIVYHVTPDGQIISDMMTLPIVGISRKPIVLDVNTKQDRRGNLIELIPLLEEGSIIGLSAHDVETVDVQGFNEITPASALVELFRHVKGYHKRQTLKNRFGKHEKVVYFPTPNVARDSETTFAFSDLIVFTNMFMTSTVNECLARKNFTMSSQDYDTYSTETDPNAAPREIFLPCLTSSSCYPSHKRCDRIYDCPDGSDESYCFDEQKSSDEDIQYLLYRNNRNNYFYDSTGGDYAWEDTFTGYNVDNYIPVVPPERPVMWTINAIGVSQDFGFSVIQKQVKVSETNQVLFLDVASFSSTAPVSSSFEWKRQQTS